jgi:hypothetical protein
MRSLLSSLIRPCYCNFTSFRFGRLLLRGLLVRATLYQVPYPITVIAQARLVSEAMRLGIRISLFQPSQHAAMMAS